LSKRSKDNPFREPCGLGKVQHEGREKKGLITRDCKTKKGGGV